MEKLTSLNLLILSNVFDMALYMAIISWWCDDGSIGQECVRHWDLTLFVFQLILNFAFCGWMIQKGQEGYRFLWVAVFWLAITFLIFSKVHLGVV